jgi:hypothetical protein
LIHLFFYSIPELPLPTCQWDFLPCVFLILSTYWRVLKKKRDCLIALEVY